MTKPKAARRPPPAQHVPRPPLPAAPQRRPIDSAPPPLPAIPWLYGRHPVAAALANPARRCRRLVALPETAAALRDLMAGARARVPQDGLEVLDRRGIEALLPTGAVHQGMALAAEPLPVLDIEDVLDALPADGEPHLVVLLDQVTDPHNIGAILRSAAAFAARAVVLPQHGAPPVTGVLAKAASGALEAVPLVHVTNLARCLDRLKNAGFWCVGLDEEADRSLAGLELPGRIALVLGAEGAGLRRLTRERCDFLARLPTRGAWGSLNVSNAAAVAFYELTRPKR